MTTDETPLCGDTIEYRNYVIDIAVSYEQIDSGVQPRVDAEVYDSLDDTDILTVDPLFENGYTVRDQNTVQSQTERVCERSKAYIDQRYADQDQFSTAMADGCMAVFTTGDDGE